MLLGTIHAYYEYLKPEFAKQSNIQHSPGIGNKRELNG